MWSLLQQQQQLFISIYANVACVCVLAEAGRGRGQDASVLCYSGSSLQRWEWAMLLSLSAGYLSTMGGGATEEMLVGGWWARQHIMSHTSIQMPSFRWDCSFCRCTDKKQISSFQVVFLSLVQLKRDMISYYFVNKYIILHRWPQLWPGLDRTCITVPQAADSHHSLVSSTHIHRVITPCTKWP